MIYIYIRYNCERAIVEFDIYMYFLYLVTGMANITIDEEQFFAEGGSELATTSQKSSIV